MPEKRIDEDLINWIAALDGYQRHALAEQLGIANSSLPTRPDGFDALAAAPSGTLEEPSDPNAA